MPRQIAEDTLVHKIYGRISQEDADQYGGIRTVKLHNCFSVCSNPKCGKLKPMSEFGMLTDKTRGEVRNQPQCRECRAS